MPWTTTKINDTSAVSSLRFVL